MENFHDFRKNLYETASSAGLSIISGDKCCQLLAWVYVYGGGHEQAVFDERLSNAIFYAQKRMNLIGSEIPDVELLPVLQNYIKSLEENYYDPPEWLTELEKEYDIKPQRKKLFGEGADV